MKTTAQLVKDLRLEHAELCKKIAAAKFAVDTLELDEIELNALKSQISHMEWYADDLVKRAGYAMGKELDRKKQTEMIEAIRNKKVQVEPNDQ